MQHESSKLAGLCNIAMERAVLGALLINNEIFEEIPNFFTSDVFSAKPHAEIFDAISLLTNNGCVADCMTVAAKIKHSPIFIEEDCDAYLIDMTKSVLGMSSVAHYATILHDMYVKRKIAVIGNDMANNEDYLSPDIHASEIIENAERDLYDLSSGYSEQNRLYSFNRAVSESMTMIENAYNSDGKIVGLDTGFSQLNSILGGLHKSDLVIVAGRPSMGKTAFATKIAFNVAKNKFDNRHGGSGVVFFSLEMSAEQLTTRIMVSEVANEKILISPHSVRQGQINSEAMKSIRTFSERISGLELFIEDSANLTVNQIRLKTRRLKRKYDIGLVVIDYLQLLNNGNRRYASENRVTEISEISRGLKSLARELDVTVLALSQLSRAVEQREDKKPQLSDLRESGAIEQDADIVMFVFREAYYKARREPQKGTTEHDQWVKDMSEIEKKAEIIIAKQRHGPIGSVDVFFNHKTTRFGNLGP